MKNRLKELREALGKMKQREFAERLGVSTGLVGQWETGKPIGKSILRVICEEFNVRREWLENGTGEMFEPGASLDDRLCGIAKELFNKLDAKGQEAVVKVLERLVESFGGEVKGKPKDNRPAWEIINERNGFGNLQINKGTINGDWRQD